MARQVWHTKVETQAFDDGYNAAKAGKSRQNLPNYPSYNERAAFKDGWDSFCGSFTADGFRVASQHNSDGY